MFPGCNNVALSWDAGTPVSVVADAVQPDDALIAIWMFENAAQRFRGFAPIPGAPNDFTTVSSRFQPAFICMRGNGELLRPTTGSSAPTPTPPPPTPTPPAGSGGTTGCCRICTTGKPCGNTCISRDRNCNVGPGCACAAKVIHDPAGKQWLEVTAGDGTVAHADPADPTVAEKMAACSDGAPYEDEHVAWAVLMTS